MVKRHICEVKRSVIKSENVITTLWWFSTSLLYVFVWKWFPENVSLSVSFHVIPYFNQNCLVKFNSVKVWLLVELCFEQENEDKSVAASHIFIKSDSDGRQRPCVQPLLGITRPCSSLTPVSWSCDLIWHRLMEKWIDPLGHRSWDLDTMTLVYIICMEAIYHRTKPLYDAPV